MAVTDSNNKTKKRWNDTAQSPFHYLMTLERIQILDILKHLISNSHQPIIVCGPEGIGKTTLLKILQRDNFISFRNLPGEIFSEADPDNISKLIDKAAKQEIRKKQRPSFNLEDIEADKPQNICLIIDDAGTLAPGIITGILRWLNENAFIQVIFVMTHDQLYLKNRSDPAIDDCHVVEVPAFTQEQSGEFLLHLSSKSSAAVPKNAITDSLIADIYRETEGIPAGIIAKFPDLIETNAKAEKDPTWILILSVGSLVAVALFVQFFSSGQPIFKEVNKPDRFFDKDFETESKLMTQIMPALASAYLFRYYYLQPDLDEKLQQGQGAFASLALSETGKSFSANIPASDIDKQGEPVLSAAKQPISLTAGPAEFDKKEADGRIDLSTEQTEAEEMPAAVETAPDQEASAWLVAQPMTNYTVQLMVLSQEESIWGVIKRYPQLQKNFKYVKTILGGKEKFVLLYGTFNDLESAKAAKQTLPAEFRGSLIRKISAIIHDFGRSSA